VFTAIMSEMQMANDGHAVGYGNDGYTQEALSLFKKQLGPDTKTFLFLRDGSKCRVYPE
jgi:threonine aldolase